MLRNLPVPEEYQRFVGPNASKPSDPFSESFQKVIAERTRLQECFGREGAKFPGLPENQIGVEKLEQLASTRTDQYRYRSN